MSIHELLPWYTNETLDAEETTAFEEHLSGCEACSKELDVLRKVQARLEARGEALLSDHPTPEHLMAALAADADDADLEPGVAVEVRRHVALCAPCADDAGWAMKEAARDDQVPAIPAHAAPRQSRGIPLWAWSLAASVLLVALATPIAMRLGADRPTGPPHLHVVEPTERTGAGPTVVAVPSGSDRIYLVFPLDVDPGSFPLLIEIAEASGNVIYSDDSIRTEDLSQQGLFLFRILPRRQIPDGRYVARIGPVNGDDVTEYPFQVIAASAPPA